MTRVPAASLVRLHLEPEGPSPGYASSALLTGLPDAAIAAVLESTGPGSGNRLTGRVWPNFAPPHDAASALRAYDPATLARITDVVETYDPHGVLQAGSYTRA